MLRGYRQYKCHGHSIKDVRGEVVTISPTKLPTSAEQKQPAQPFIAARILGEPRTATFSSCSSSSDWSTERVI